jgi:hypothetical protein
MGDLSMKMHSSLSSSAPPTPSSSAEKNPLFARNAAAVVKNLCVEGNTHHQCGRWMGPAPLVHSLLAAHIQRHTTWYHQWLGCTRFLLLTSQRSLRVAYRLQHSVEAPDLRIHSTLQHGQWVVAQLQRGSLASCAFGLFSFALSTLCAVGAGSAMDGVVQQPPKEPRHGAPPPKPKRTHDGLEHFMKSQVQQRSQFHGKGTILRANIKSREQLDCGQVGPRRGQPNAVHTESESVCITIQTH